MAKIESKKLLTYKTVWDKQIIKFLLMKHK